MLIKERQKDKKKTEEREEESGRRKADKAKIFLCL
jgi:hypothetical protein